MPKQELYASIGRRVSELRQRAELTQRELARAVQVSVDTISRLERGANIPGVTTLVAIATAAGVEPHEILIVPRHPSRRDRRKAIIEDIVFVLGKLRLAELELVRGLVGAVMDQRGG